MSWYKKSQVNDTIRYRALGPIDVWIEDTGDEELNKEKAYEKIIEILLKGSSQANPIGFEHQIHPSDIQKYSNTLL